MDWQDIHRAGIYQHWPGLAAFLRGTGIARGLPLNAPPFKVDLACRIAAKLR